MSTICWRRYCPYQVCSVERQSHRNARKTDQNILRRDYLLETRRVIQVNGHVVPLASAELYPTVCSDFSWLELWKLWPELFFLKIRIASWGVQLVGCSTIFGVTFDLSCSKAVNFGSKLALNSDESIPKFRERQRIHSFLSKDDVILSRTQVIQSDIGSDGMWYRTDRHPLKIR